MIAKFKAALLILFASLVSPSLALATLTPLTTCTQLKNPKTILVVHMSTCPACKLFMPEYEKLSNNSRYKEWTFYEEQNDSWSNVCDVEVFEVPQVYVNNMHPLEQNNLQGLIRFLADNK